MIGGGIGGLTAALLLSKQRVEVTLYERSTKLGGRIAFEEEGPYRIDQGPTIVLLPEMLHSILEEAGIARERIELLRCDPLYRIHYRSGKVLTKRAGRQEQSAEIENVFPGEGRGFDRFMKDMDRLFPPGQAGFLEKHFQRKQDFWKPNLVSLMAKMRAYKSLRGAVGHYFTSDELKDAYSLQSLYIGGAPFKTPGIYSLLPYAEHEYGVWMLKGGYGRLPEILREELEDRGVKVHLNTEVTSIEIVQGRVKGLKANGKREDFDAVIYNGEFPGLPALLEGVTIPSRKPYAPSSGCVLIYAGVKKRWTDGMTHQFFLPDSLHTSLKEVFDKRTIPADPAFYIFNPVSLDEAAAPPGESVLYFLIPVPDAKGVDWEREAPALADLVLKEAEKRGFPGLLEHLRWQKIRTPMDAERDGLYGGGSFGIAPILSQSGVFRPQPKPYAAISGLYAAGASVHPGGGVPIVMQGAKLAVDQLIKEMSI